MPILEVEKAPHAVRGVFERAGANNEYLGKISTARGLKISTRNKWPTCKFPLNDKAAEIPAMGT